MKNALALVLIACLSLYAQTTSPSIGLTLPVNDNSVKSILDFNLKNNLQTQIEAVHKQISDKMIGEFHVGGGYVKGSNPIGVLAVKVSPYHSKIAGVNTLKANVFRIRQTYEAFGETIPRANDSLLRVIEMELKLYEKAKWKRPSFGIVFPYNFMRYDTSYSSYYQGDSLVQTNKQINSRVDFHMLKMGVFAGYDIGDFCTLSAGIVDFDSPLFFAGITIDISTPTYWMVSSFKENVRSLSSSYIPRSSNDIY